MRSDMVTRGRARGRVLGLVVSGLLAAVGCGSSGGSGNAAGGGGGGEVAPPDPPPVGGDDGSPGAPTATAWAVRAGGPFPDVSYSIDAFPDDGGAAVGFFSGRAVFGNGEEATDTLPGETELVAARDADVFFARYTPEGRLAWARRAGGEGIDVGYSVDSLPSDRSSYSGCFDQTAIFGPGEERETALTSRGTSDVFVARLTPQGRLIWAKQAGGENYDIGYGVSNVGEEAVLAVGQFREAAVFGPGEAGEVTLRADGSADIFLARLNGATGNLEWVVRAGGIDFDRAQDVAAYADGSSIVTGLFRSTSTWRGADGDLSRLSNGFSDGFLARHDPDGNIVWVQALGGAGLDAGRAVDLLPDGSGDFCAVGYFEQTARFGLGADDRREISARGVRDGWVARYGGNGRLRWVRGMGGPDDGLVGDTQIEEQQGDQALGVAATPEGGCLVTGTFDRELRFDGGDAVLRADVGNDAFTALYDADGALLWARTDGGGSVDVGFEVAVLSGGGHLGAGGFALDLDFAGGSERLVAAADELDAYFVRVSPDASLP